MHLSTDFGGPFGTVPIQSAHDDSSIPEYLYLGTRVIADRKFQDVGQLQGVTNVHAYMIIGYHNMQA